MGLDEEQTRVWVDIPLLKDVKEKYPEIGGMTFAGVVDWALRKLLNETKGGK